MKQLVYYKYILFSCIIILIWTNNTILGQGFSSITDLSSITTTTSSGKKPQSKVWKHDGNWWAVLPITGGTYLWKLVGVTWTSHLQLSSSSDTQADIKSAGDITYVLLFKNSTINAEFVRVQYSTGAYSIVSGGPGSEITISLDTGVETATIDVDSNGKLWVASDGTVDINVRWSSDYTTWSGPIRLNDTSDVNGDDICAVTSFGGNKIGVIWSNQSAKRFGFRYRNDSDTESSWQTEEIPASTPVENNGVGNGVSDDHINIAVSSTGIIYAAIKTAYDTPGYPAIGLLVRQTNGSWDSLYKVQGNDAQTGTRPLVLLSEASNALTVIYTEDVGGNDIVYKESDISPISFPEDISTLRRSSTDYNDVSSTKELYTDEFVVIFSESDLADFNTEGILAENEFVAYYKMNEGSGTTLVDASYNDNDGTISGSPSWSTAIEDLGINFDGSSDYATIPDDNSLDITTNITFAAWIKPSKTGEQIILEKEGGSSGYSFFLNSSGSFSVRFNNDDTKRINTAALYSNRLDKWVHFAVTYDGSKIRTYVNGKADDSLAVSFSINTNSDVLSIGANSSGSGKFFGSLDQVHLYNGILSESGIENLAKPSQINQLVGHWAMEEKGGITLVDSSSSKNHASIENGPSWDEGIRGMALVISGNDGDYCTVPDDPTLNISKSITLATWVRPESVETQRLIRKVNTSDNLGYSLFLSMTGKVSAKFNDSDILRVNSTTDYPIDGSWMHIAVTYDKNTLRLYIDGTEETTLAGKFDLETTENDLTIGGSDEDSNNEFQGRIDDVRIYNYALSSAQISDLQNTWIPTTPSTVDNGAGYGLDFDGTNDYVNCGNSASVNITGSITIEAWVKPNKNETQSILKKDGTSSGYELSLSNGNIVFFRLNNAYRVESTSKYPKDGNTWTHIAATYDGADMNMYINGVLESTISGPASIVTNTNNLVIGTDASLVGTFNFDGGIDEVRLWNVARTSTEIQENMCKKLSGSETGLVSCWSFDVVSGTTVADLTSNNNGTMTNMNVYQYTWSGSAIGDASSSDYNSSGGFSASLSHTDGDQITATATSGTITGIQVYREDANSMRTNSFGPDNYTLSPVRFWGVKVFGSGTPTYTITYNYSGHPGITDEDGLKLVYRENLSDATWEDLLGTLDTGANTIVKTGQTGTEYSLATFNDEPLPVELGSFTASLDGRKVILKWTTETEVENYGFEIQRSISSAEYTWNKIGFIEGSGNFNSPKDYSFIDDDIEITSEYNYRLKQMDTDGAFSYSNILTVSVGIPDNYSLSQNYPNPFNPQTKINFSLPEKQKITLSVYNILGELVNVLINEEKDAGNFTFEFNSVGLASGIYIYILKAADFMEAKKMTLLK